MAFQSPNFAQVAEAMDTTGTRIEDPGDVPDGLAAAFAHKDPLIVDAAR